MYNGSPEMTQGKDEQLIIKKKNCDGRKDGTTDRGHYIGPFPSLLGGPKNDPVPCTLLPL